MGKVAVIGGGASGLMAAWSAAEQGSHVVLVERNDRVGKKILATGNGKCNFSNRDFSTAYYYGDRDRIGEIFRRCSMEETVALFQVWGMLVKERQGYLYPRSEQAATVLDILRMMTERQGVQTLLSTQITRILPDSRGRGFRLYGEHEIGSFDSVVIACGGQAAPKTGSDGAGYRLVSQLGHRITDRVPALVQLRCSDSSLKLAAGVRCDAGICLYDSVTSRSGKKEKRLLQEERGELQITDYGISGIPVFQLSRTAGYALLQGAEVTAEIDFFPDDEEEAFVSLCRQRAEAGQGRILEESLLGFANKKINQMMIRRAGKHPGDRITDRKELEKLYASYRKLELPVCGTNSFDQAQVTAGGVPLSEVTADLESIVQPGIFLAGEILDVDGRCGGYNLQWAWSSGRVAGIEAARRAGRSHGTLSVSPGERRGNRKGNKNA